MGNKAILMSIQTKWVAKILNGEKTIEVRKKFPKDYVGWVYIYNTKRTKEGVLKLIYVGNKLEFVLAYGKTSKYQGKVVARFWCNKVEEMWQGEDGGSFFTDTIKKPYKVSELACISDDDIEIYFDGENGYAIHITRLEILDKPMVLTMFRKVGFRKFLNDSKPNRMSLLETLKKYSITKAPQSWQYIED